MQLCAACWGEMSSSENGNSEEHVQKKVKLENGTSHDIPKNEVVTTSVTENDHKSNDHEDDDEDNIPITELLKRKSAAISSTSTENTPKTPVSTPRASKTKAKTAMVKVKLEEEENENEKRKKKATTSNDDDDDSDDDIPIAQLLKKKKEEIKKVKEKIQTKTVEVKKEKKEKSSTPSSTPKKTRVSDKKLSTSDASDNFYNTKKGQLVQKFLVRWWYAVTWPEEESIVTIPEGGYEPLEGFPGVFICTSVCFSLFLSSYS